MAGATQQTLGGVGRGERPLQAGREVQREDGQRFVQPFSDAVSTADDLRAFDALKEQSGLPDRYDSDNDLKPAAQSVFLGGRRRWDIRPPGAWRDP